MDNKFGGVIWTNHALARLNERGIKQGDAWATWKNPDQSRYAASKNAWVYYKTYGKEKVEVVAKQNEKKEWLILSVWSKPVYEGHKRGKQKKSGEQDSFWKLIYKQIFNK